MTRRDHRRADLAAHKCHERIEFTDELPKRVVGKILRRALRARWAERMRA
jgi:long-chain acyl-CoA synthetase